VVRCFPFCHTDPLLLIPPTFQISTPRRRTAKPHGEQLGVTQWSVGITPKVVRCFLLSHTDPLLLIPLTHQISTPRRQTAKSHREQLGGTQWTVSMAPEVVQCLPLSCTDPLLLIPPCRPHPPSLDPKSLLLTKIMNELVFVEHVLKYLYKYITYEFKHCSGGQEKKFV
jgi:hypothetical protein